jgi:hypothetical protein
MTETRIASAALAQVLGIQGLFSGSDSYVAAWLSAACSRTDCPPRLYREMEPVVLPDALDKAAIAGLPDDIQLK